MIPHNLPTLGMEEQAAAARVLASGWVAQGPEVEEFENELCRFLGLPDGHAIAVSSGSAALFLALWALDGKNKLIGLPVYACAALRNAVGLVEGKCAYLDCEENGPNVDMAAAAKAGVDILIAPSMFGIPVDLPNARDYLLIEDLAQALGARVGGERIGLRGELGICSFYATKLITTGGQGGAVISRDRALIERVRDYRQFDSRKDTRLRFNFQMTDMQAAVGRVQLAKLPEFVEQRERLFGIYANAGLELLGPLTASMQPVRYRAVMRCTAPSRLIETLQNNGIRAIVPVEQWELLDEPEKYPMASRLASTTVSLPIYPTLAAGDARRVAGIAGDFA
ncbi:MAG: DegT/DnrJ/EryC1/StrS aminotransferase family protein [Gallionella sp.]|nr:DegT/DnrJ/EryC1/StrS aminotransferase family protein [Gallionella sp.]